MNQNEQQNGGPWKCGNEFLPFHPQASHVDPSYRDGWNACYRAALSSSASEPVGEPTNLREVLEEFDHQLTQWARAYPERVFPEPDMDLVRTALEARGITIDCVSASNMRHVVTQLNKLFQPVRDALSASPLPQEPREAEQVCYEAYQVVGSLLSDLNKFDTDEAEKILDNLSQARLVHTNVLPWPSYEPREAELTDEKILYFARHAADRIPESNYEGRVLHAVRMALASGAQEVKAGEAEFTIENDDGVFLASASGLRDEAWCEINHYAAQYAEEGSLTIYEVTRTKVATLNESADGGGEKE